MTITMLDTAVRATEGINPRPNPSPMVALNDSTGAAFDAAVLPAASAWLESEIVGVEYLRRVTLRFEYDAHASTTTGYPQIMVFTTAAKFGVASTVVTPPTAADDVWFPPMITDGVVTAAAATGTLPSGATQTNGPLYGQQIWRPLIIKPPAAVAHSDKILGRMTFDVTDDLWLYVMAQELGDTTNRGKLKIWANGT